MSTDVESSYVQPGEPKTLHQDRELDQNPIPTSSDDDHMSPEPVDSDAAQRAELSGEHGAPLKPAADDENDGDDTVLLPRFIPRGRVNPPSGSGKKK